MELEHRLSRLKELKQELIDIYNDVKELKLFNQWLYCAKDKDYFDDAYLKRIATLIYHEDGVGYIFKSFKTAEVLFFDQIYKLENTNVKSKEALAIKKLLEAREEDFEFELRLAQMIDGDNKKFPYKTGQDLTTFFQELGHNFIHDGSTRVYWVADQLKLLNIVEIYTVITRGLFKKKYFLKSDSDIEIAKQEFNNIIGDCINANEVVDLHGLFGLNINNELLFNKAVKTDDNDLNELIEKAREYFIKEEKQTALEKIWDAFERLKTYLDCSDKKKSASALCELLAAEIEQDFFNKEFKELTQIGNDYQIRHFETSKTPITDIQSKEYLFFRMLSLINLALMKLESREVIHAD